MVNSYSPENGESDKCLVDDVLDILPLNDSADAIELLLRVLSTLPVEVSKESKENVHKVVVYFFKK